MSHNTNNTNNGFLYTCPSRILTDKSLTLNDLKIYMVINSFMYTTGEAYPSNNWIANKLDCTRVTVIRSINKLISKSYIHRIEINGVRYLSTTTPIPEKLVSPTIPLVSPSIPPTKHKASITPDTPLVSPVIPNIYKDNNINNYNNTYSEQSCSENGLSLHDEDYSGYNTDALLSQEILEDKIERDLPDVNLISTYSKNGSPGRARTADLMINRNPIKFSLENILTNNQFNIPQSMLQDWIITRNRKKTPVTQTAWCKITKELIKCHEKDINPIEAFETMVASGWQSLKVDYFLNKPFQSSKPQSSKWDVESVMRA